ncbi:MAG: hypothetical protein HQK50_08005 [Oligoflexia bacterium]|nr:hypothetical protein [Oligoflexia bacterium]MBF0365500.1 hypothetical protein [Oligoflexia bacterium]
MPQMQAFHKRIFFEDVKNYFLCNIETTDYGEQLKAVALIFFCLLFFGFVILAIILAALFAPHILKMPSFQFLIIFPLAMAIMGLCLLRAGQLQLLLKITIPIIVITCLVALISKSSTASAPYFITTIFYMLIGLTWISLFGRRQDVIYIAAVFMVSLVAYNIWVREFLDPLMQKVAMHAIIFGILSILLLTTLAYLYATVRDQSLARMRDEMAKKNELNERINHLLEGRAREVQEISGKFKLMNSELSQAMDSFDLVMEKSNEYGRETEEVVKAMLGKTREGADAMKSVVSTVDAIGNANYQLNEIVEIFRTIISKTSIINEIVFETKVLSFNAAIEAARAGKGGSGFAVVAEEVGQLAKKSGDAADEISSMLEESRNKVAAIVENIQKQSLVAHDISNASLEKFTDIAEKISYFCEKIEQVKNATLAEERVVKGHFKAMQS